MNDIEIKRAKYDKWGKVALIGFVALVVSPIIFMVVKGIVGLAIAGALGMALVMFTPVASMKLANWRIKSIVGEAKENPLETLQNLIMAKKMAFAVFKDNVEDAVVGFKTFTSKIDQFKKQYPSRAKEFIAQADAMSKLVSRKQEALVHAQQSIAEGENKLVEMKAYWEMSQIAQAANKAAGMDTGDQFEKLKLDTACDAVFESMNRAFAEMEVAADLSDAQQMQLENNASPILEEADVVHRPLNVGMQRR